MTDQRTDQSAVFLRREPCPSCGSRDNLARYSDGHGWCFGCHYYEHGEGDQPPPSARRKEKVKGLLENLSFPGIRSRRISPTTAEAFGYGHGTFNGKPCHVMQYRDKAGKVVAQKLRLAGKKMPWVGNQADAEPLWGMHRFKGSGRRVVITEGEIDAMSVSQIGNNKWPTVSLSGGASAARKNVAAALEWLRGFEEIVLWFDSDEPGQKAVEECLKVLPVGKVSIVTTPMGMKDANDLLVAGHADVIQLAIFEARPIRPDGIINLADIIDRVKKPVEWGTPYWDERVTQVTYGRRLGEAVALGAGTGVGKTDWIIQQIMYDVTELDLKVGLFLLEQDPGETGKRLAGKFAGKPFHIPEEGWTQEELEEAVEAVSKKRRVYLYDHFGQASWEEIEGHIRYLHEAEGVSFFYLDHLTALATEKEDLEEIMASMGGLVKELNIWILFVSHLATPDGKPHEEGGRVTIRHFKGSRAIGFWSSFMFGLERDQQADDEAKKHTTTFRVLKDRYTGRATGYTCLLGYNHSTGRLIPTDVALFPDDDNDMGDIPI